MHFHMLVVKSTILIENNTDDRATIDEIPPFLMLWQTIYIYVLPILKWYSHVSWIYKVNNKKL